MKKERKKYIESCELSELREVELGGYRQKILIEAKRKATPVILFLHGGPGFPAPFCVGARGLLPDITEKFTAVYWDQLGCGINNRKITDKFHMRNFEDMTVELCRYLKEEFPESKLYLFGMSWGSVLAAKAAQAVPELLDGVYTAGQVVLPPLLSEETLNEVLGSKASGSVKKRIVALYGKEELSFDEMNFISKTVRKYTGGYGMNADGDGENVMSGIFASKDYKLRHKLACIYNGYRKNTTLTCELSKIDLRELLCGVKVKYRAYGGDRDLVTPVKDCGEIANKSENFTCTVVEGEAHFPSAKMIKRIFSEIAKENE